MSNSPLCLQDAREHCLLDYSSNSFFMWSQLWQPSTCGGNTLSVCSNFLLYIHLDVSQGSEFLFCHVKATFCHLFLFLNTRGMAAMLHFSFSLHLDTKMSMPLPWLLGQSVEAYIVFVFICIYKYKYGWRQGGSRGTCSYSLSRKLGCM